MDMMKSVGDESANLNAQTALGNGPKEGKRIITILENKKRRTDTGDNMGLNMELQVASDDEFGENMDHESEVGSKNVIEAGSESRARLRL